MFYTNMLHAKFHLDRFIDIKRTKKKKQKIWMYFRFNFQHSFSGIEKNLNVDTQL